MNFEEIEVSRMLLGKLKSLHQEDRIFTKGIWQARKEEGECHNSDITPIAEVISDAIVSFWSYRFPRTPSRVEEFFVIIEEVLAIFDEKALTRTLADDS